MRKLWPLPVRDLYLINGLWSLTTWLKLYRNKA